MAGDTEEQQTERGYILLLLAGEEYWISITSTCLGGWLGSIVPKERIEASGAILFVSNPMLTRCSSLLFDVNREVAANHHFTSAYDQVYLV